MPSGRFTWAPCRRMAEPRHASWMALIPVKVAAMRAATVRIASARNGRTEGAGDAAVVSSDRFGSVARTGRPAPGRGRGWGGEQAPGAAACRIPSLRGRGRGRGRGLGHGSARPPARLRREAGDRGSSTTVPVTLGYGRGFADTYTYAHTQRNDQRWRVLRPRGSDRQARPLDATRRSRRVHRLPGLAAGDRAGRSRLGAGQRNSVRPLPAPFDRTCTARTVASAAPALRLGSPSGGAGHGGRGEYGYCGPTGAVGSRSSARPERDSAWADEDDHRQRIARAQRDGARAHADDDDCSFVAGPQLNGARAD